MCFLTVVEMSGLQTTWEPIAALHEEDARKSRLCYPRSQDPLGGTKAEVHWEITKSAIGNISEEVACEMRGWMNHKLESRLQGEISTLDMQMILP